MSDMSPTRHVQFRGVRWTTLSIKGFPTKFMCLLILEIAWSSDVYTKKYPNREVQCFVKDFNFCRPFESEKSLFFKNLSQAKH